MHCLVFWGLEWLCARRYGRLDAQSSVRVSLYAQSGKSWADSDRILTSSFPKLVDHVRLVT
jgi:hypothetical protein